MGLTIPPRTTVSFDATGAIKVPLSAQKFAIPLYPAGEINYKCSDCNFETKSLEAMEEHQLNQAKYHTRKQKLMRWLDMNILWVFRC